MTEIVERNAYLEKVGKKIVKEEMPELAGVRIGYAVSSREKKTEPRIILAECMKVNKAFQAFMKKDFVIVFYEPNTSDLTEDQVEILMRHELMHIGFGEEGEPTKIVPHDVQEFRAIIDRYGLDWAGGRDA